MKKIATDNVVNAQRSEYRRDIDGLRAVSVLAVLLFHAFPSLVQGGFVGVDVFFVISGYLITGIISWDIDKLRFSIVGFYRRRILRIFPALIIVLVAAYALGWWSLYSDEFKHLALHMLAGGTFTSNILLWTEAGYFDVASSTKPLLHLWSLGVEEQFYLLWPLILLLCANLAIRVPIAIAAVALISFGVEIALVGNHPVAAFFLPLGRLWELAAGGLLALAPKKVLPPRAGAFVSIAGLTAIIGAALWLREGSGFPGWYALLPTLGAVAVIAAGPAALANDAILSRGPMVEIGRISYPLYLWHWLFLSFAFVIAGGTPRWSSRLILLGLSLFAAWATYFFIERRIRNGRHGKEKAIGLCLAMIAIMGVAGLTWKRDGLGFRRGSNAVADVSTAALGGGKDLTEARCLIPPDGLVDKNFCVSDKRGAARILLWGDSKAEALYWGMMRASSPDRRWSLVGRWACPPFFNSESLSTDTDAACIRVTRAVVSALMDDQHIETVVLTFSRTHLGRAPLDDQDAAVLNDKPLEVTVEMLLKLGKTVVLTLDNPDLPDPRLCMDRATRNWPPIRWIIGLRQDSTQVTRCDRPLDSYLSETRAYRAMIAQLVARHPEVLIYDPTPVLCDLGRGVCPMVLDHRYLYSYGNHISDSASDRIAKELLPIIERQTKAKL
jgi:peptidoglycan/LPS O-acetylase OafA/YrhL